MDLLTELEDLCAELTPEKRVEFEGMVRDKTSRVWVPNPGRQTEAYLSTADIVGYGGAAGGGKGLDVDTLLPTQAGFVRMADVKVGDTLFDQDGSLCNVIAVSPVTMRPCFKVRFDDGAEIIADDVHRWLTLTATERAEALRRTDAFRSERREHRPSRVVPKPQNAGASASIAQLNRERVHKYLLPPQPSVRDTSEILGTLTFGRNGRVNHSVDVAMPINGPKLNLPIDPYLLGLWLGDGTSAGARMTIAEPEMVALVTAATAIHGWDVTKGSTKYDYGIVGGMRIALRGLGVLGNKHIPMEYRRASAQQRRELLRGLLDTDGYCDVRGRIQIGLSNRVLAEDVAELVCGLGIKARLSTKVVPRGEPSHRLVFHASFSAFKLSRKFIRQRPPSRATVHRRYIVAIEPVPSVPTRCIAVDSPSRTYLVGRSFIPTHNTDLLLGSALTQHHRSVIFRRAYVDLRAAEDRLIEMLGSREGYNAQDMVYRSSKRMIEFGALEKPGSQYSWQGRAHDLVGFDEGAQLSVDKIQYVSGWLRSTDPKVKKQVIIATNPPMGGEGAWFFEWFAPWIDPVFGNPAAPGDVRWAYNDSLGRPVWVDGPGVTIIAGRNYTHESRTFIPALLDDNPYLVNTDYRSKIENLPEPLRSQLLYGDFMAGRQDHEWQVIPTEWVRAANDRWRAAGRKHRTMIALAMDVAMGGEDATTIAKLYEGAYFDEIIERSGVSFNDPTMHAALLIQERRDQADISVDATGGWGTGVLSHLKHQHGVEGLGGLVFSRKSLHRAKDGKLSFKNLRAEMWWRLREGLNPDSGEDVKLPPDPRLLAQLTAPRYFIRGTDIVIEDKDDIRKRTGGSVDRGDAVVMAWHRRGASARRDQRPVSGLPPMEPYLNRLPPDITPDARDAWMLG